MRSQESRTTRHQTRGHRRGSLSAAAELLALARGLPLLRPPADVVAAPRLLGQPRLRQAAQHDGTALAPRAALAAALLGLDLGHGARWEGRADVPAEAFVEALNEQIGHEFAASQQYVACAIHYDAETLPRLAAFFYRQAVEERNHAMMMIQYLLDAGVDPVIPGVAAPQVGFDDIVAPVALALAQERRVSDQINALAGVAREHGDYASEQFMQWFIKEQVEEVATMSDLLKVVERSRDDPMEVENFMAREHPADAADDLTAPKSAGAGA